MPHSSFSLCQLYDAFKALEAAFGSFGDMLYAVKCSGLGCDERIQADDISVEQVVWLEGTFEDPDGGGGRPCTTSPQYVAAEEFLRRVSAYVEHAPGVIKTLEATLDKAGLKKIEYLTRRDRKSAEGA